MRELFWISEENDGTNADTGTPEVVDAAVDAPVATPTTDTSTPAPEVAAAPAVPATPSWLDSLREHNLPVGKDEAETIANLRRIAEERHALESIRGYIPHVQKYLKDAPAFAKWQQEQQAPAAPAKQSADDPWWKPLWSPPEFNPLWEQYIVRGPDGKKEWHPEAPLDVQQKYAEYQRFTQDQVQKFTQNPYEYMGPAIDQRVNSLLEQKLQEQMQRQSEKASTTEFIQKNESWLFELDADGQRKQVMGFNPQTGEQTFTPVLSQYGQIYAKHAKAIDQRQAQRGYHDEEEMKELALLMTQRDAAAFQQQPTAPAAAQTPPPDPQKAANDAFLKKANPPGKNTKTGNMKVAEEPITSRNLERAFLKEMQEAGFN